MFGQIKSLASDTVVYGIFSVIGRFLTFLLTPLYTNYLTKTELGEVMFIYSIIAFLNILFSFGIESSFFRFYNKNNIEESRKVFSHTFLIIASIAFSTAISVLATADVVAYKLVSLDDAPTLIRLAILIPFFDSLIFIPYAFLRMTGKAKKFATTRFVLIIIAIVNNFIFVVFMQIGAIGVILSQLIASSLGMFFVFKELRENLRFKIDFSLIKQLILFGLPTLPANISAMVLQVADRPIIKSLAGVGDLAVYSVNYKLAIPMMILVTVFDYAWKPFYMSRHEDVGAKELYARVYTYFTLAASAIFLTTSLFMEFAVRMPFVGGSFVSPEYWSGLSIIPLILVGFYLNGAQSHFAAGFLITKNTKYIPICVGIAALISMLLNFILIPFISYYGSALALIVGYFIGAALLFILQKKIYIIQYEWRRIAIIILSSGGIYLSAMYFTQSMSLIASFIVRIASIFAYIILLFIFGFFNKNEIQRIKQMISRKHYNDA